MDYRADVEHALLEFACTFPPYEDHRLTSISEFSSGLVFAHMLVTVKQFPLKEGQLERDCPRWIQKLTNLKKLVQKIENYVGESDKQLKTKDLDLIEIAKHNSSQHILRLFQMVIAVFMQSPHKEDYIQTIMRLDERSQHALVIIVENAMNQRLADSNSNQTQHHNKLLEQFNQLSSENQLLKEELEESHATVEKYRREAMEYRERLEELEDIDQKQRKQALDSGNYQKHQEIQQLKSLNDNLKQKLLQVVRDHQQQLARARQQNIFLQNKMIRFKQYEDAVQQLKQQLAQMQSDREKTSDHDRERRRLNRIIEQKEAIISKLRESIDDMNEKNVNMQETEFTMKMELERKEFRFKQLENQVKTRLKAEPYTNNAPIIPVQTTTADAEELDYLQEEVQKLRNSSRELDRENLKLKKKLEKTQVLQAEKKKLQKIILDVSKSKEVQIEMLLVSLYELRSQNIRMNSMLKNNEK